MSVMSLYIRINTLWDISQLESTPCPLGLPWLHIRLSHAQLAYLKLKIIPCRLTLILYPHLLACLLNSFVFHTCTFYNLPKWSCICIFHVCITMVLYLNTTLIHCLHIFNMLDVFVQLWCIHVCRKEIRSGLAYRLWMYYYHYYYYRAYFFVDIYNFHCKDAFFFISISLMGHQL